MGYRLGGRGEGAGTAHGGDGYIASARGAGWSLKQGESRTYKHRLVVYTGQFNKELIDQTWAGWAGKELKPKN